MPNPTDPTKAPTMELCNCPVCHGEGFVGMDGTTCDCIKFGCKKRHKRDDYLHRTAATKVPTIPAKEEREALLKSLDKRVSIADADEQVIRQYIAALVHVEGERDEWESAALLSRDNVRIISAYRDALRAELAAFNDRWQVACGQREAVDAHVVELKAELAAMKKLATGNGELAGKSVGQIAFEAYHAPPKIKPWVWEQAPNQEEWERVGRASALALASRLVEAEKLIQDIDDYAGYPIIEQHQVRIDAILSPAPRDEREDGR